MNPYDTIRPDPDELLASLKQEDEKRNQGKLKIFFGMCAGVGKTYSMLKVAQIDRSKGVDVVVGYVETHQRAETEQLLEGLEIIPRKEYPYKGTLLQEMDLDAVLLRHPQVVLVDELAHSNAPGSRHSKRFQDVQEILNNGIDVYSTVNVQHLESRGDTVSQITGVIIRESLPDEIFEKADEVELVDLTPDELLERLSEGKIYVPEHSLAAMQNFFRKGNITALREMALRLVADRVDKQVRLYMQQKRIPGPWKSGLHLLAVIGPSPQSATLIRWAKNLSYTMGASLLTLYVEPLTKLSESQKDQLGKNINLAKQLGADYLTTSGPDVVRAILNVAHKENITHIIIGKPRQRNLIAFLSLGNFLNRLIRHSGNIDVYVLGSDRAQKNDFFKYISIPSFTSHLSQYFLSVATIGLTAVVCYPFAHVIGYQVVSFILLFVVSILATFMGIGPILLASTLSSAVWNYLFIPPKFTLNVARTEDILMLGMFFFIALLNGILTSKVRRQERLTRDREERTNSLYRLTRALSQASGLKEVLEVAVKAIKKHFSLDTAFILQNGNNVLTNTLRPVPVFDFTENDFSVAAWSFRHDKKAGKFTDTLPSSALTFYPLPGTRIKLGVIAIKQPKSLRGDEEVFWETFLTQISNAIEREFLDDMANKSLILEESDKLYKTLFNSVSHELRIPVTTIMGAADTLLYSKHTVQTQTTLYKEIYTASERLNRLIENLLNISRLESGRITPRLDWCDVHDLANKVTDGLKQELLPFKLDVVIPMDMPLVMLDFGLIEQVLHNLVFNATQYAPAGTVIRIKMYYDNQSFVLQVTDRGAGFPENALPFIFNKFYRVEGTKAGGTGLGLSIVKGFVEAHNGKVKAENRENGGARITVVIPSPKSEMSEIVQ